MEVKDRNTSSSRKVFFHIDDDFEFVYDASQFTPTVTYLKKKRVSLF